MTARDPVKKLHETGQVDVTVRMDPPVEGEGRSWVQLDVLIAKHAELKQGDQVVVHIASQSHLRAIASSSRTRENVRVDACNKAAIW